MDRISNFALSEKRGIRVLLTAEEAFPELERAFLGARREIWASFRIFDLSTRLRTEAARRLGDDWFDLVVAVLARGVKIRMILSDFDPIARPVLHGLTWKSMRQFIAAAELAGPTADLDVVAAPHPARTGILPALFVWPFAMNRLRGNAAWLNLLDPEIREATLRYLPGLLRYLERKPGGQVQAVRGRMPALIPATHHQKLATFDRQLLYIGGLDLNERRYDDLKHQRPGERTWHDVQLLTDGAVVAEAQVHLEKFPAVVAGLSEPPPQRRLLRTLSRRRVANAASFGPEPVASEIALAHGKLCDEAQSLIYLETQFFRDRRFARALARAARAKPGLHLLMMLPAAPEDIAFDGSASPDARYGEFLQWRCLKTVARAFGKRLFVGAGAQPRRPKTPLSKRRTRKRLRGAELVYIHSKVSIFDETRAIVSSANLNGRSLRWDTEAGLLLDEPETVKGLRDRVFRHWLPEDAGTDFYDNVTAVQAWRELALTNARRDPEDREGFVLPYDFKACEKYGMPLPVVPEEMV